MLEDGTYDVIVLDATDDDADPGAVHLELAVVAGPHKGEVLAMTARGLEGDALDLLAVPGTVAVADGVPNLTLEG